MPRYVVERTFPDGLNIPVDASGAAIRMTVVQRGRGRHLGPLVCQR
jgi:hypothetical protein